MKVLIAEHRAELGLIWSRFLERHGAEVRVAPSQKDAIAALRFGTFDALVVELVLPDGGAIAIADYASYRHPEMPILTVSDSGFFSDGSIFEIMPNVRGVLRGAVPPADLVAMLDHYCGESPRKLRA